MEFRVGDEVMIRSTSEYYGSNDSNPAGMKGEVVHCDPVSDSHCYNVRWTSTGLRNAYRGHDLMHYTDSPPSELYARDGDKYIVGGVVLSVSQKRYAGKHRLVMKKEGSNSQAICNMEDIQHVAAVLLDMARDRGM